LGDSVKSAVLLIAVSLPFLSAININFDSVQSGQLPPGWSPPQGAQWIVQHDPTAPSRPNVLARAKGHINPRNPVCFFDQVTCTDGDISVKMKILSGKDGQDAGVIFRATDQNNYYLVRVSTRDHNVAMFRVQDGHFEPIRINNHKGATFTVPRPLKVGDWNLLRVTYKGTQASVFFNHRKVFDANDASLSAPGRAGVWTNADTVAYFDDFRIDKKR
jgi:hypothetical protein